MSIRENVYHWKQKLNRYSPYKPAIFFVTGFVFDVLTLGETDNLTSIIQQCLYMLIAGVLLNLMFLESQGRWQPPEKWKKYWGYRIEVLHFILGGLLSIYTLFYFVSSSLSVSLLFLVTMFVLLIVNEWPRFQKNQLVFKYVLYYVCMYSFFMFLLPLVAGTVSVFAFLGAILVTSLLSLLSYLKLLKNGIDKRESLKNILIPSSGVGLLLLGLYMAKILPPVPLSAKYMGIYHSVGKQGEKYKLGYTRGKWRFWQNGDQSFYAQPGDKIICFVQVFAPSVIAQNVFFHWQQYQKSQWVTMDKVPIRIQGGRQHGFRGYVIKSNYTSGDWRVLLENIDGREIGRISFEIIDEAPTESVEYKYNFH